MLSLKMIRPTVVRKCSWPGPPVLGVVVELHDAVLVGELGLLRGAEDVGPQPRAFAASASSSFASSSASGA